MPTLHHEQQEHKHIAEPLTGYQRFVQRILVRILELSTIELIVATLHLSLTAAAVFGLIGAGGGEGH